MSRRGIRVTKRTGQQRSRDEQQRGHRASVRMNAAEYEAIAARATAAGMTVPSYLVYAGMELDMRTSGYAADGARRSAPRFSTPQQRAFAAEILGLSRHVRQAGNNLNQLTRYAHTERRRPDELPAAVSEMRDAAARLVAFLDDLRALMGMNSARQRVRDGLAALAAEGDKPDTLDTATVDTEAATAAEQYEVDDLDDETRG